MFDFKPIRYKKASGFYQDLKDVLEGSKHPGKWSPCRLGTVSEAQIFCRARAGRGELFFSADIDGAEYFAEYTIRQITKYIPGSDVTYKRKNGKELALGELDDTDFVVLEIRT